ncbi:MAG TPA: hypothetical protein HPQ04_08405 [Rhodospirillaceae bacterium]|nr:hypothetical protein [Rhodospirillaceae bacterium]
MSGYGVFEYFGMALIVVPCLVFMTRRARRLLAKDGGCGGCSCGDGMKKGGAGQCG